MRLAIFLSAFFLARITVAQNYYMFIGTYTSGKSVGIYVYKFNALTGVPARVGTVPAKNPSYLALSASGHFLYCVNENGNAVAGGVSAYSFNKATGQLHFINERSSGGADPCYVTVNRTGKWALVANYNGGNLSALPIRPNGSLDSLTELIQHYGKGTVPDRQEKAHVHSVVLSPDERFVCSADLGLDKEMVYRFDPAKTQPLTDAPDSFVNAIPGSGPRHFVFNGSKPYAYLIEELSGTVDAYHYSNGQLIQFQRISTHPEGYQGAIGSADIHISPDGKFLYASNRGDANSLAIFSIDPENGRLRLLGVQPTLGKTPRNFIIDPTGHFLLVANQESDNIVIFRINRQTGMITPTGKQILIPNPVCIKLLKD